MFCCIAMLSHHNDIKTGEFHRNRGKNRRETMLVQGELEKRCMNDKKKSSSQNMLYYMFVHNKYYFTSRMSEGHFTVVHPLSKYSQFFL